VAYHVFCYSGKGVIRDQYHQAVAIYAARYGGLPENVSAAPGTHVPEFPAVKVDRVDWLPRQHWYFEVSDGK